MHNEIPDAVILMSWSPTSQGRFCDPFTPSQQTLADIDYIFEVYHNPVNPMSKIMTPKRRRENDVVESQPSKYTAHHPTAEDFHLQPCCCNSAACWGLASIDLPEPAVDHENVPSCSNSSRDIMENWQPIVGTPVLATSRGEPYLAGIVASVEGEVVTVHFQGKDHTYM
ncbi:uncharacterized protein LOC132952494 [Metopolophium dirhodum]|uniref:uncharacterized protein LOC132952494 n=1 Tax=Metopolophium dirhodum TaxID=44670 RepID=UPI0029901BB6|nr:uncharacterized protein LOC132952494 [Metopolophium dirhodum]